MGTSYEDIAKRVQAEIDLKSALPVNENGWVLNVGGWGKPVPPAPGVEIPGYVANPTGNPAYLDDLDKFVVNFRYGNWAGGAYGGGHLSPTFHFENYDLTTAAGQADFDFDFAKFTSGEFYERPDTPVRDKFDEFARYHDLLYQDANLAAAAKYRNGTLTKEQALAEQQKAMREADVWWLSNSEKVIAHDPYGIAVKNLGDLVFGAMATGYYVEHLPDAELHTDKVIKEVGSRLGSRLGQMIAGEGWFAQLAGTTLGGELGEQVARLFIDGGADKLTSSILELFDGKTSLAEVIGEKLDEFGINAEDMGAQAMSKLANLLLAEAAEALGLGDFASYALVEAGGDLADFLIQELTGSGAITANEMMTLFSDGVDFADVGAYLADLTLEFVGNSFIRNLVDGAKGLVEIDSVAEGYFAEFAGIIGSVIGQDLIPVPIIGAKIGEIIGHILGSIVFEALDGILGGALSDLFDEDPVGVYYVALDPATGHLAINHAISDNTWDRNGASHVDLNRLKDASLKMSDAYLEFVNGLIDLQGGTLDLSAFDDTRPQHNLNHAAIGFHDHRFQVIKAAGGDKFHSNDPQKIITEAIEYEALRLNFQAGDLAVLRALNEWKEIIRAEEARQPRNNPVLDNTLGILSGNLQIASDYRFYLDNAETINLLMQQQPGTPFTLGWLATLARAAELGLNLPYLGSPDGAAGTAGDDKVLSADGNDKLYGNGGNDLLKAYGGDDEIFGGDGNDTIFGGTGKDKIGGDLGNDTIDAGPGDDAAFGYDGTDLIRGGLGNDMLGGDAGADRLEGDEGDDKLYGGADNDQLYGGEGRDLLLGDAGDDLLNGEAGNDQMSGFSGRDQLNGGEGDDQLAGEEGDDRLDGGRGNDVLYGDVPTSAGSDVLLGGDGNDYLRGGGAADQLNGGEHTDQLYGDDGDDTVTGGGGDDQAWGGAGNDVLQGGNGKDTLSGEDGDDAQAGGAGDDMLYGHAGNDVLRGGGDNDSLNGDTGDDQMFGDAGNDRIAGWKGNDTGDGGDGNDTLLGEDGNDRLAGGEGDDTLYGDRDTASGPLAHREAEIIARTRGQIGAGDFAVLYGGPTYSYQGLLAADHDLMIIPIAASVNTNVPRSEILWTRAQVDAIEATGKQLIGYLDLAKINDFTTMWQTGWTSDGTATGTLTGNAPSFLDDADPGYEHTRLADFGDPTWRALLFARIDTMIAQGFSGVFLDDVGEYFTRDGLTPDVQAPAARDMADLIIALADHARAKATQSGGNGAEFRIIVNGAPFLIQDGGADGQPVSQQRANAFYGAIDAILVENYFTLGLQYGVDQAVAEYGSRDIALLSLDTGLATEQQRITIERQAVDAGFLPEAVPDLSYFSATPRFVAGFGDTIAPGDDVLEGGAGDDRLFGGAGSDRLVGGIGNDRMVGGDGVDLADYSQAAAAVTVNLALTAPQDTKGAGTDTIREVENLLGSWFADTLAGSRGVNRIDGGAGADRMDGDRGDDVYIVDNDGDIAREGSGRGNDSVLSSANHTLANNIENLTLLGTANIAGAGNDRDNVILGNSGANTLGGGAGDDRLDGGAGADVMKGGMGNDVFVVDSAGDKVVEKPSEGVDTVDSWVSLILASEVEILRLMGSAMNGTGNSLANTIKGNNLANRLDGLAGADRMEGGNGDDVYVVDNVGDRVIEGAGKGNDSVESWIGYTLAANVENLTLLGAAAIGGAGNELNNRITGNNGANTLGGGDGDDRLEGGDSGDTLKGGAGNDTLYGGLGADKLFGGLGADTLVFDTALGAGNVDTIGDFDTAADTIRLDRTIFAGVAANGALALSAFRAGTAAADADDRIIYDPVTGNIWYDADGIGATAAVQFARVAAGLSLTNADFMAVP